MVPMSSQREWKQISERKDTVYCTTCCIPFSNIHDHPYIDVKCWKLQIHSTSSNYRQIKAGNSQYTTRHIQMTELKWHPMKITDSDTQVTIQYTRTKLSEHSSALRHLEPSFICDPFNTVGRKFSLVSFRSCNKHLGLINACPCSADLCLYHDHVFLLFFAETPPQSGHTVKINCISNCVQDLAISNYWSTNKSWQNRRIYDNNNSILPKCRSIPTHFTLCYCKLFSKIIVPYIFQF